MNDTEVAEEAPLTETDDSDGWDHPRVLWFVLAVVGGSAAGTFYPYSPYYLWMSIIAGLIAFFFRKRADLPARNIFLVVAVGLFTASIAAWNTNWTDTYNRDQDRKEEAARREEADVRSSMHNLYGDSFKMITIDSYSNRLSFRTVNDGCSYWVDYIPLEEPNTYGPVENEEVLIPPKAQVVNGHAEMPICVDHPLAAARSPESN